ncbi:MAG: FkbM family methyltransferase [Armatimonadetes bacterium]|nr:FkbM family methyltransferase [Armatimonadota bacterium]
MGKTMACQVGKETILLDLDSDEAGETRERNWELWRAQTYTTKEPDTLAWIDAFLREGDVVYDVGANIGQYSLYAAKRGCKVLAFEPEALNYAKLNRNIVLNELGDSITAYCLAVTDRTTMDVFYVKAFSLGASLHAFGAPVGQGEVPFAPGNRQGMLGVSLDDLAGRFGLPFPHHIKVDVDGIEDRIVRGAAHTLEDPRLKSMLIEVYMHKEMAAQIRDFVVARGLVLRNASEVTYKPGTAQNLLFTR